MLIAAFFIFWTPPQEVPMACFSHFLGGIYVLASRTYVYPEPEPFPPLLFPWEKITRKKRGKRGEPFRTEKRNLYQEAVGRNSAAINNVGLPLAEF